MKWGVSNWESVVQTFDLAGLVGSPNGIQDCLGHGLPFVLRFVLNIDIFPSVS
jgi:hypothetical protein